MGVGEGPCVGVFCPEWVHQLVHCGKDVDLGSSCCVVGAGGASPSPVEGGVLHTVVVPSPYDGEGRVFLFNDFIEKVASLRGVVWGIGV